jgi:hypothetical protein
MHFHRFRTLLAFSAGGIDQEAEYFPTPRSVVTSRLLSGEKVTDAA